MTTIKLFFQKCNCTPEERRKLIVYLIAMRLTELLKVLGL
jgi:hypothetical protein